MLQKNGGGNLYADRRKCEWELDLWDGAKVWKFWGNMSRVWTRNSWTSAETVGWWILVLNFGCG